MSLTSIVDKDSIFVRLTASGKDRARFLHNFCTNNVKALSPGDACEAFFADVKARTLAHGYVLAFEETHEIWMLPGDPAALEKHLNRYVITEDVRITITAGRTGVFLQSPALAEELNIEPAQTNKIAPWCVAWNSDMPGGSRQHGPLTAFAFTWAGTPLIALGGDSESFKAIVQDLSEKDLQPLNCDRLEQLRISERFPVIGTDMTGDNLSPEAERNKSAISYTKGCYLGQEPIARLDAMGHVNRALRIVEILGPADAALAPGSSLMTPDGINVGTVTSAVLVSNGTLSGLAMLRLSAATQTLACVTARGETFPVRVVPVE